MSKPETGIYPDTAHGAFFHAYDTAIAAGATDAAAVAVGAQAQIDYATWGAEQAPAQGETVAQQYDRLCRDGYAPGYDWHPGCALSVDRYPDVER